MKKLERDRNKMLLEIQSNDSENFNAIANTIIKKDNLIKSVKLQISDFQKAVKNLKKNRTENQNVERKLLFFSTTLF